MQLLCCLASRRQRACRLTADYVQFHGGKVNCTQLSDLPVEPALTNVAKECCLCKTVWMFNGSKTAHLKGSDEEAVNRSVCPGPGCCALLTEINMERSDFPSTSATTASPDILTTTLPRKTLAAREVGKEKMFADSVDGKEDVDFYDLNFIGGLDMPEDDFDYSTSSMTTMTTTTTERLRAASSSVTVSPPTPQPSEASAPVDEPQSTTKSSAIRSKSALTAELNNRSSIQVKATQNSLVNGNAVECHANYVWDAQQELCVRLLTACPIGMFVSKVTGKCIKKSDGLGNCSSGYYFNELNGICEDINECESRLPSGLLPCNSTGTQCVNLPGSYNCTCESGFQAVADGTCVDINECNQRQSPCKHGQNCRNLLGSYQCLRQVPCGYGYVLNPENQQCEDVDECKADPNICGVGMLCINVRGGHKCVDKKCPGKSVRDKAGNCVPCGTGFVYNASSGLCDDIDECHLIGIKCAPWERCVNKMGYFVCAKKIICEHGTRLNANGTACEDIDECKEKSFSCNLDEVCVNTPNAYVCRPSPCTASRIYDYEQKDCKCPEGMRDINGNCKDINECEENENACSNDESCINIVGGFRCVRTSRCLPGFKHDKETNSCEDINECQTEEAQCGETMYCVNTIGSYQCLCKNGFKNVNSHNCEDVDECQLFGPHVACPDPRARCVNTNGSHLCVCPEGFTWLDYPKSKCVDLNECQQKPERCGKEHRCINLDGSYRCECARGYRNTGDQKSCLDIDECKEFESEKNSPCPNSLCVNTPGGYICKCPEGFELSRSGQCQDIDECSSIRGVCTSKYTSYSNSQTCVNLMGGYRCVSNSCPPSYTKSRLGNGYRCQLNTSYTCRQGDYSCQSQKPTQIDNMFVELDQHTSVPQILSRVNTLDLPMGVIRADLRQHYANQLTTRNPIDVGSAFKLQRSRTQPGTVEVLLTRRLPAPVDILISLHLVVVTNSIQVTHNVTKFFIFVTQSLRERVQSARNLSAHRRPYRGRDFWKRARVLRGWHMS